LTEPIADLRVGIFLCISKFTFWASCTWHLAVGGHPIETRVEDEQIPAARTARDQVGKPVLGQYEIRSAAPPKHNSSRATDHPVVSPAAHDSVASLVAFDPVVPRAAAHGVVAGVPHKEVVTAQAAYQVVAAQAMQSVATEGTDH